jgi:hypothetical protein
MAANEGNANRRTALLAAAQSMEGVEYATEDILNRASLFLDWLVQEPSEDPEVECGQKYDNTSSGCMKGQNHKGLHTDREGRSWRRPIVNTT